MYQIAQVAAVIVTLGGAALVFAAASVVLISYSESSNSRFAQLLRKL